MKKINKPSAGIGSFAIVVSTYVLTRIFMRESGADNLNPWLKVAFDILIVVACVVIIRKYKEKLTDFQYKLSFLCLLPLIFIIVSAEINTILSRYDIDLWNKIKVPYRDISIILLVIYTIVLNIFARTHRKID